MKVRKIIQEEIKTFLEGRNVSNSELISLEHELDRIFADIGVDVVFTKHFMERVRDARNKKDITIEELRDIFKRVYSRYKDQLTNLENGFEGVFKKRKNDINVPFALVWDKKNKEIDLINKTVMRKRNFKTTSPVFPINESLTVYRGSGSNYDSGKNPFKWVALDRSVASNYASFDDNGSANVEQMEIESPKNVFHLPYKSKTEIKASDLQYLLMNIVTKKYRSGELSHSEGKGFSTEIKKYVKAAGDDLEKFHTKINKKESAVILHSILKKLGFDAVGIEEENENGKLTMTYGLI